MEGFSSGLSGSTLNAALTAGSQSLTLRGVPTDLPAGRYTFKIDAEIITGSYSGSGLTFRDLQRGTEGTTAATHRAGVVVFHPISSDFLNRVARTTLLDPALYVRSPGMRAYLASNFT